jgi:hypothetical protein
MAAACPAIAQTGNAGAIRAACAAMGLDPHEAPFFYCVRSLQNSAPARPYAMRTPTTLNDATPYRPSNGTAANACAAIGLDPATARYSYCVSDLQATIDQENNIGAR